MRIAAGDPVRASNVPSAETETGRPSQEAAAPSGASRFAKLLRAMGDELSHGENMIRAAVGSMKAGVDFSPTELIALQVGVYRYSEAIDLASHVVDRTTSGVKTILQGSGQ